MSDGKTLRGPRDRFTGRVTVVDRTSAHIVALLRLLRLPVSHFQLNAYASALIEIGRQPLVASEVFRARFADLMVNERLVGVDKALLGEISRKIFGVIRSDR